MSNKVKKFRHGLSVRVLKALARDAGIVADATVELVQLGKTIVIETKSDDAGRLGHLTAQITEDNRHDSTDFGSPVGREVR